MKNKEILMVVDVISNEKEIDRGVLFEAIEAALAMATKKQFKEDVDVRVSIDQETGDFDSFRRWEAVEADPEVEGGIERPDAQLLLEDAKEKSPDIELGGFIEEQIESAGFGRIGAQAAKQVIVQKVREAERKKVYELYKDKVGELVTGRSEEHTSELQSLTNLVCRLLLEKKKLNKTTSILDKSDTSI